MGGHRWLAGGSAVVELDDDGLQATGVQLGVDPGPIASTTGSTSDGFATRRLEVEARGADWSRRLDLERRTAAAWTADATREEGGRMPSREGGPPSWRRSTATSGSRRSRT